MPNTTPLAASLHSMHIRRKPNINKGGEVQFSGPGFGFGYGNDGPIAGS
jgi:hypothetical protein